MLSLCLYNKYLHPKLSAHAGKIAATSTVVAITAVLFASLSYYNVGIFSSPTVGYITGSVGVLSIFDAVRFGLLYKKQKSTSKPTPPKVFVPLTRLSQPEISENEIEPYFVRPTSAEEHFPLRLHTFSSPSGDKISIAFRKKRSIIGGSLDEWTFLRYPLGETPDVALALGQFEATKEEQQLRLNDPRVKTETAYSLAHAASLGVQTVIYEIRGERGRIGYYWEEHRKLTAYITEVYKDKKIERLFLCNNTLLVVSPLTHEQVASKVISYITEHSLPTPKVFYTLDPGVVLVACPKLSNGYNFRTWHYLQNGNIKDAKESTSGGQSFTRCRNLECYSLDLDKDIEDPSIQTISIDDKEGYLLNPMDLRNILFPYIDNSLSRVPIPTPLNHIIVNYLL